MREAPPDVPAGPLGHVVLTGPGEILGSVDAALLSGLDLGIEIGGVASDHRQGDALLQRLDADLVDDAFGLLLAGAAFLDRVVDEELLEIESTASEAAGELEGIVFIDVALVELH